MLSGLLFATAISATNVQTFEPIKVELAPISKEELSLTMEEILKTEVEQVKASLKLTQANELLTLQREKRRPLFRGIRTDVNGADE